MMRSFCLLLYLCPLFTLAQVTPKSPDLRGKIVSAENLPIQGASIRLLHAHYTTVSGTDGNFQLTKPIGKDTLLISYTGYLDKKIIIIDGNQFLTIRLESQLTQLDEVVVNTGYQSLPKERSTGSFVQIDKELLNRRVSTNILDRLDGITSGLIFNRNKTPAANESDIVIRGRSTIYGQVNPLIIVDNFPYDGDISNINPNEVESITILKDASAASIWGVRSGNGVIVITTKKGKAGQAPKISFNTNITVGNRPNLYYQPTLDANNYIAIESFLFSKGYYNSRINNAYQSLSPVVDILAKRRAGLISSADSSAQIGALQGIDVRNDLSKYFYRPAVSQQYALTVSGGSVSNQYFLMAGYDKNISNQKGYANDRININAKNNFQLIPNKLELSANLAFTSSTSDIAFAAFNNSYPIYQKLVDANGKAVTVYNNYRKSWLDTIGQGQLLDWTNRPYDELGYANNHIRLTDYRMGVTIKYKITKKLDLNLLYQYQDGRTNQDNAQGQNTYFTRDIINRYTQVDYIAKNPVRNAPLGTILDNTISSYSANSARAIANYNSILGKHGQVTVLAGTEIKDYHSFNSVKRLYGYNSDNATDIPISATTLYPTLPAGTQPKLPYINTQSGTTDRYLSYFANAGYSYQNKYLLTISARKDESNLFGVAANQKGVPLWSAGLGWILSQESFFKSRTINYLKLRLTYGYNGNVDKSTTAYTTGATGLGSIFNQPTIDLVNPPNPDLSWEKTSLTNLAVDFGLFNGRLQGSLEGYYRKGTNLTGISEVASQTGVSQFRQNIADISGQGIDFTLSATPVKTNLVWEINFLYSYNTDRIDRYLLAPSSIKRYVENITSNPVQGKPWSAIYAFKWNGLNPSTGDPQGFVSGSSSTDFTKLVSPGTTADISYIGPGRPTHFGSIRNNFSYKHFGLSCNIVYEMGYFYRRSSVNYANTFSGSLNYGNYTLAHGDLAKRWQKPGDELTTNVPSLVYPAVSARDEFYTYSEVLVEKGDHIRLRDIQAYYDINLTKQKSSPFRNARVYLYANNIGIIWRANHSGIDPDAVTGMPAPFSLSAGVNIDFK